MQVSHAGAPDARSAPSVLDRPVGGALDDGSRRLVAWGEGPARTPLTVLFVAYTTLALIVAGSGVLLAHGPLGAVREWDLSVSQWLVDHRTPFLDDLTRWVSSTADTAPIAGTASVTVLVLAVRHRWRDVLLVAGAIGLEVAVFLTANSLARRPRPDVAPLGSVPDTFSFPSGHVAATLALWGCIALLLAGRTRSGLLRVLVWSMPFAFAAAVAFARVYRGMHYTTDVVAGALLGAGVLVVAVVAARTSALADDAEHGG